MPPKRILLDPNPADVGGASASIEKPSSAPAAAPAAAPAKADATPPASDTPASDDPFEMPAKPAAAATTGSKPAAATSKPAAAAPQVDFDTLAPKELRARVKALNQEKEQFSGTIKTLEAKIKEFDSRGADTTALTTRLAAIEKERDSAQAELRAARQEASPDFKREYEQPFNDAAQDARREIETLYVINEDGTTRPATWDDFKSIYSLPTGKAIDVSDAMFGKAANLVQNLRKDLLNLESKRERALAKEKSEFKERNAKEIAEKESKLASEKERFFKNWNDTNKRLSETIQDYKVDPTDAEAVEAQKHALQVFDDMPNPIDEVSLNKKVVHDAHIRQRVGAYAVQKIVITRQKEQIAKLQAQIDELKGLAPGGTQRSSSGDEGGGAEKSWEQELVESVGKA